MFKNLLAALAFTFVASASTSWAGDGTATLTSQDNVHAFAPAYAAYYEFTERGQKRVTLLITDRPDVCGALQRMKMYANSQVLEIRLGDTDSGRHTVTSTMRLMRPDEGEAKVLVARLDEHCKQSLSSPDVLSGYGMDGAVTLQNHAGDYRLDGAFAATFADRSVIRGTFSAARCEMPYDPSPAEMDCE